MTKSEPIVKKYHLVIRSTSQLAGGNNTNYDVQLSEFLPPDVKQFQCEFTKGSFDREGAGLTADTTGDPTVRIIDIGASFRFIDNCTDTEDDLFPPSIGTAINFSTVDGIETTTPTVFNCSNMNNARLNIVIRSITGFFLNNAPNHMLRFTFTPI